MLCLNVVIVHSGLLIFSNYYLMTSLCVMSLQKECGFEYTSKLQCMFQDTSLSKDLNDSFKSHVSATTPLQGKLHIISLMSQTHFILCFADGEKGKMNLIHNIA